MSLLEKASLVITPNAYKESVLYSVVPNTTLGDMDVVRATTATRVNSAGLIEVVPRNLITYSEQIDNADWVKTNLTVTANSTTAPNGTTTAEKLIPTTTNSLHIVEGSLVSFVSGNSYTFSFYAKRAENNFIQITASSSLLSTRANFNLLNGTLGFVDSGITATITAINNDWYRCTASFVAATTGNFRMVLCNIPASTSARFATFSGNGTSGLFVWGVQVDNGSTATEYFPTTTRLNIPRIDYTNGSCPSLLVEPQRTNFFLSSQQFDDANWVKASGTVTANVAISPDGTQNADILNNASIYQQAVQANNTTYCFSVYVKKNTSSNITIFYIDNVTGFVGGDITYTYLTNTIVVGQSANGSVSGQAIDVGNGWIRLILKYTTISVVTFNYQSISSNGSYIFGAQFEQGSYPTSYIPTVASAVTRNADVISKTGISSLIGQTEGTIFFDFKISGFQSGIENRFSISDNSSANWIFIGIPEEGNNKGSRFFIRTNGSTAVDFGDSNYFTLNTQYKIALAYKSGDWAVYINGTLLNSGSNAIANPSSPFTNVIFNGSNPFVSNNQPNTNQFNSVQLYKTRLTNAELQSLTTL